MGYDVYIHGEVTLKSDKFNAALTALQAKAAEEDDGEPSEDSFEDLVERLSQEHFQAHEEQPGEWIISPVEDAHRHEEEAEGVFEILAPFLNDGSIQFEGEDGCEWAWNFRGGKLSHDNAAQIWGEDQSKLPAFDEIVSVLYPDGKVRTKFPKVTLDKIATIIRKAGFGPFAGLSDLEAVAKAAE